MSLQNQMVVTGLLHFTLAQPHHENPQSHYGQNMPYDGELRQGVVVKPDENNPVSIENGWRFGSWLCGVGFKNIYFRDINCSRFLKNMLDCLRDQCDFMSSEECPPDNKQQPQNCETVVRFLNFRWEMYRGTMQLTAKADPGLTNGGDNLTMGLVVIAEDELITEGHQLVEIPIHPNFTCGLARLCRNTRVLDEIIHDLEKQLSQYDSEEQPAMAS